MRLYDRLMHDGAKLPAFQNRFGQYMLDDLKQATVISADNVCEYFYAISLKEYWTLDDFPNIAPPFETCFIEMLAPSRIVSEEHGITRWDLGLRPSSWGVLFSSTVVPPGLKEFPDITHRIAQTGQVSAAFADGMLRIADQGGGWMVVANLIWDQPKGEGIEPAWSWVYGVDKQGKPLDAVNGKWGYWSAPQGLNRQLIDFVANKPIIIDDVNVSPESIASELMNLLKPALLAKVFLHCRNVAKVTNYPDRQLVKARQRRGKPPLCKFVTLKVHAFGERKAGHAPSSKTDIEQGYHIVRGHFKTYTHEKPLLGRAVGTYWWAMHAAGSKKAGVIAKDYDVVT